MVSRFRGASVTGMERIGTTATTQLGRPTYRPTVFAITWRIAICTRTWRTRSAAAAPARRPTPGSARTTIASGARAKVASALRVLAISWRTAIRTRTWRMRSAVVAPAPRPTPGSARTTGTSGARAKVASALRSSPSCKARTTTMPRTWRRVSASATTTISAKKGSCASSAQGSHPFPDAVARVRRIGTTATIQLALLSFRVETTTKPRTWRLALASATTTVSAKTG